MLAWVYQLRRFRAEGGDWPETPVDLPVPAELDKGTTVAADEVREEADDALGAAGRDGSAA